MAYCNSYWLNIVAFLAFTTLHHILAAPSLQVTPKNTHKLSLRLIHRHSIFPIRPSQNDEIRAHVLPRKDGALLMANISIGEPPVPQLLPMDTGSHITWTRCSCRGCFDPKKSSSYKDVPLNEPPCNNFDYSAIELDGGMSPCSFQVRYADTSFSRGSLAFETYTFTTSDDGTVQVPDAVLGCAVETRPSDFEGILGLVATTPYHLLSRTGNKFSYCIGNINDPQYMYNQLILGEGAVIQGDSTPIQIRNYHYVVSLEGINVGDTSITMNPLDFKYNVIFDSGSTYTRLRKSAYEPLAAQITMLAQRFFLTPIRVTNPEKNQLCYKGDPQRDLKGFPIVTLHLAEGVDIDLDVDSLFRSTIGGLGFCMTIIEADQNVIGLMAQQYYNVGFDVRARRLSLERIDCQLLED